MARVCCVCVCQHTSCSNLLHTRSCSTRSSRLTGACRPQPQKDPKGLQTAGTIDCVFSKRLQRPFASEAERGHWPQSNTIFHRGSRMQIETARSEGIRPSSTEPAVAKKSTLKAKPFKKASTLDVHVHKDSYCDDPFVGEELVSVFCAQEQQARSGAPWRV